jgi:hypothetical protein
MAYFKIGDKDYSNIVNAIKVIKSANYNAQTNAAGDTVVDFINHKRIFEVGIIPLSDEDMLPLLDDLNAFNITISFRNPQTNELEENINCIIPETQIEYYTIQVGKVSYKTMILKISEL